MQEENGSVHQSGRGSAILLIAGIISIIPGLFGMMLMFSSLSNSFKADPARDTSEVVLSHLGSPLFLFPITILVLGILLVAKRNSEKWASFFLWFGLALFVSAMIFVGVFMAFGFFGIAVLLVVPILMMVGGSRNRKKQKNPNQPMPPGGTKLEN